MDNRDTILEPKVILDVLFEEGMLFLVIHNISGFPAHDVRIRFSDQLIGVNGRVNVSELNIFQNLRFLAPGKPIKVFLDSTSSFFRQSKVRTFEVRLDWANEEGHRFFGRAVHDLSIYEDLGYINLRN